MNKHLVSTSGKLVPQHQYSEMPKLKHENVFIPSTSAPAWGGYFVFDIKDKNYLDYIWLLEILEKE